MRIELNESEFMEFQEFLKWKHKSKIDPEWLKLQKEIRDYCCKTGSIGVGYRPYKRTPQTVQDFIYGAIRFVTGVHQMKELTGENVLGAYRTFKLLVQLREQYDPDLVKRKADEK